MIRINVTGIIGYSAASKLLDQHRQELEARFSRRFIREFERLADIKEEVPEDVRAILTLDIVEGGLFGALWQLCEQLEASDDERFHGPVGLRADLEKVPIKQEVIEICDLYGEDPYETASPEAQLIVWDDQDAEGSPEIFEHMAGYGTEIGHVTNDNRRIINNGDQIRFLTPADRQMKDMVDRQSHY